MTGDLQARYTAFCAAHPACSAGCAGQLWTYRESGPRDAPAVVLLPGALGRPETSFEYITAFSTCLRVIAPGYPTAARTLSALCDGIAGLLDTRRLPRAHIVGGSFGGLIAQAFLRRYADRVERLVLSDTTPPIPARTFPLRIAAAMIRLLPLKITRSVIGKGIGRYLAALPAREKAFWKTHFSDMLSMLSRPEIESRARLWAAFDQMPLETLTRRETLILGSKSDRAVSPRQFRRLFPHARTHLVASGLGHAASIGDAPAYIEPIRRFLIEGHP